jgi:cytochrome c peroxidase
LLASGAARLPPLPRASPAEVELGRRLFYDADLSADGTMSCATCHEQHRAFAEGNATHPGVTGEAGRRNVPGLANIAHIAPLTFADPSRHTLEEQALVPIAGTHPVEMGMKGREAEIARRLAHDACYRRMFRAAFPKEAGGITFDKTVRAVAAFERGLVSLGAPYDRGTLSPAARQGQRIFAGHCAGCHAGPLFTDLAFHRLGQVDPRAEDQGLFEASHREEDRGAFRTPSLRNVALTGPWWHDGSAPTIAAAIARHGLSIDQAQTAALLAFLDTLSDADFISNPAFALPQTVCGRKL